MAPDPPAVLNGLSNVHQRGMIRVVLMGPAYQGVFPYRVETVNTRLASWVRRSSATPLTDACNWLLSIGAADTGAPVGLFPSIGAVNWTQEVNLGANITGELTTIREEPLPPRHKYSTRPIGMDRDWSTPNKTGRSRHIRKRAGSGGRRGQR